AKLMIVDDVLLRVGSANLNNRSMGVDTECDLAIEARTDEHRRGIGGVLHRLLGEHLGVAAADVAERLERSGSLIEAATTPGSSQRGLAKLRRQGQYQSLSDTLNLVADPEAPLQPAEFIGDMFGASRGNRYAVSRVL